MIRPSPVKAWKFKLNNKSVGGDKSVWRAHWRANAGPRAGWSGGRRPTDNNNIRSELRCGKGRSGEMTEHLG